MLAVRQVFHHTSLVIHVLAGRSYAPDNDITLIQGFHANNAILGSRDRTGRFGLVAIAAKGFTVHNHAFHGVHLGKFAGQRFVRVPQASYYG